MFNDWLDDSFVPYSIGHYLGLYSHDVGKLYMDEEEVSPILSKYIKK